MAAAEVTKQTHEVEPKHLQNELGTIQTAAKKALDEARKKVDNRNNISTPVMTTDRDFTIICTKPAGAGVVSWVEDF